METSSRKTCVILFSCYCLFSAVSDYLYVNANADISSSLACKYKERRERENVLRQRGNNMVCSSDNETENDSNCILQTDASIDDGNPEDLSPIEYDRLIVIGDIHGSLTGLIEILENANVIVPTGPKRKANKAQALQKDNQDETNKKPKSPLCEWDWSQPHSTQVIQMGDIVDRGPRALESYQCLESLTEQLRQKQEGNVDINEDNLYKDHRSKYSIIRLVGNHDIWWLEGHFHMRNTKTDTKEKIDTLVGKMRQDITNGDFLASYLFKPYSDIPFLFTHAGYRETFLDKYSYKGNDINVTAKVELLNQDFNNLLVQANQAKNFNHEYFDAGPDRGGQGLGGPMWTDFKVLEKDAEIVKKDGISENMIQVVGHSAAYSPIQPADYIRVSHMMEKICVDGGMFTGQRSFLEIDNISGHIIAHFKENSMWKHRDYSLELCA